MSQQCPIISPKLIPTIGAILRSLSYSPIHFFHEIDVHTWSDVECTTAATCEDDDEDDQQVAE